MSSRWMSSRRRAFTCAVVPGGEAAETRPPPLFGLAYGFCEHQTTYERHFVLTEFSPQRWAIPDAGRVVEAPLAQDLHRATRLSVRCGGSPPAARRSRAATSGR